MAIYYKLDTSSYILYLRNSSASGYTLYSSGYLTGSVGNQSRVVSVVFETNVSHSGSMIRAFNNMTNITSLDVSRLDTSAVTSMESMFSDCRQLTTLDLSNFNTSNVTSMYSMFSNCYLLESVNLSSFNTSNVTTMAFMFASCYALASLDVSNFDTSRVTNFSYFLTNDNAITYLDLSNFNTSSVTTFADAFWSNSALETINITSFNTSSATNMYEMFRDCTSLQHIKVGDNWNTSNVTSSSSMFKNDTLLPNYVAGYYDKTKAYIGVGGYLEGADNVIVSVSPENYGIATGGGYYSEGSSVTLTATPSTHKVFTNWALNGTIVSTSSTYTFTMGSGGTYIANFDIAQQYDINTSTSPSGVGSVYQSISSVWQGESVTLRAREEKGYNFSHWSDGSVANPRTITNIQGNINLTAYYVKNASDNTYYQYRAYVKDALSLNELPKAFLVIRSFTIRRDLLTTAKSKFNVLEIPSNLNEGDVFVLYDPKGTIMYYGIISSIDEDSLQCTQIQSFYSGKWVYETYASATTLEQEVSYLLGRYAQGYQKGSSYQDLLINQEKAPLRILTEGTTNNSLETKDAKTSMDFEKFIYSLYESYGLVFDFYIPFSAWTIGSTTGGSVTIRHPSSAIIKIGTNAECIKNMTPTTKIEQTNKLIVYSSAGVYRTTYVATTTNGIVQEPSSIVGRFGVVNTKIVYSDDELATIRDANITEDMFNHIVEFTLLLDNNLYDFWSWELGQQIKIYDGSNFFDSVFTGYELSKGDNQNPTEVKVTCGKVRNKLTSLLSLKGVVQ